MAAKVRGVERNTISLINGKPLGTGRTDNQSESSPVAIMLTSIVAVPIQSAGQCTSGYKATNINLPALYYFRK